MERKEKKIYYNPTLEIVNIDRKMVLMQVSDENDPPDPPLSPSSSSKTSSSEEEKEPKTQKNNFDENPFQR
ncbi:MAG: hypothetical protein ACOCTO_00730 [Marinilabiliaceae bacterium]